MDVKTLLTLAHLLGVAVGAGGAFTSDALFLSSVRDGRLSATELRFLKVGSRMVWTGLAILAASGAGLFLTDPPSYLASSKFLAKMTVVAVITANGLVFHAVHIPRLLVHSGGGPSLRGMLARHKALLLASGAVSGVSWLTALALGASRTVPLPYAAIVGIYLLLLACAVAAAVLLRDRIIPRRR